MRRSIQMVLTAALMAAPMVASAQGAPAADEQSRSIKDGGVKIAGWKGMIDAAEAKKGLTLENAKLAQEGKDLRVTTGPAAYQGNFSTTVGLVLHKSAVGTVKLMDLATEAAYDIRRQGTLVVAKYAMGHGVIRPEAAVELKTS